MEYREEDCELINMNLKTIRKKGYTDRVIKYSLMWVNGRPKHNYIDNECVVDFSCCYPELFTNDLTVRQEHHAQLVERLRKQYPNK